MFGGYLQGLISIVTGLRKRGTVDSRRTDHIASTDRTLMIYLIRPTQTVEWIDLTVAENQS